MTQPNHLIVALQGSVTNAEQQHTVGVLSGASGAINAAGPVYTADVLTTGGSQAHLILKRPVLLGSGGDVRVKATMRAINPEVGRVFFVGLSNDFPATAGRDFIAVGISSNRLTLTYAVNGGTPVEITREASFASALPVFDITGIHTYDLTLSANGAVSLSIDGKVVLVLPPSLERMFQVKWAQPIAIVSNATAQSVVGGLEVYDFAVFSERAPASRLQNVTSFVGIPSTSAIVVTHLISELVEPTWAEVERVKLKTGTGELAYALGLGTGVPVGTPFTPAGNKVGSIGTGGTFAGDVATLGIGRLAPTDGEVVIWDKHVNGPAVIQRNDAMFSGLLAADFVSLLVSLQATTSGGTAILSVDYSTH